MPYLVPIVPVDRVRAVLLPAGLPGLGAARRPRAWSARRVQQALAAVARHLRVDHAAWATVTGVVWCWHDHLDEALAAVEPMATPTALALRAVVARRQGHWAEAHRLLRRVGRPPWVRRLGPVAAAEGWAGSLVDDRGLRLDALVDRCRHHAPEEVPGLTRVQAAELLIVVQVALGG